jgi:hypothetical protein
MRSQVPFSACGIILLSVVYSDLAHIACVYALLLDIFVVFVKLLGE